MITNQGPYRGELVCRDLFLALSYGVEEQVLQAGQNTCLSSPERREGMGGGTQANTVRLEESTFVWCGG